MSDENNVVVETTEEAKKAEKAKALKRRSSIGRFFDGVKSLLGLSTGHVDEDSGDKNVEETAAEEEMDVEPADEDEIDSMIEAEQDDFLAEDEEVKPDPKLQAIKKMNLPKKEKIALAKQRRYTTAKFLILFFFFFYPKGINIHDKHELNFISIKIFRKFFTNIRLIFRGLSTKGNSSL